MTDEKRQEYNYKFVAHDNDGCSAEHEYDVFVKCEPLRTAINRIRSRHFAVTDERLIKINRAHVEVPVPHDESEFIITYDVIGYKDGKFGTNYYLGRRKIHAYGVGELSVKIKDMIKLEYAGNQTLINLRIIEKIKKKIQVPSELRDYAKCP